MVPRNFDPKNRYRIVLYLRMSDPHQNPRSPDQQEAEIIRTIKALGYDWVIVKVYRDDAISGRLLRQRLDYQQMLRDLKSGEVVADLIAVDTLERFGRIEEIPTIRKELRERYGILVVTADSNFGDPTSPQGKALAMVETMRATEHGRILAHNVARGKRDAVLAKHWPGGDPPFGFMLKTVLKIEKGREEVDYSILMPNPETQSIIVLLFTQAAETGWGTVRLARFLNEHREIPDELKPFQPETVGRWLDNEIYYGELHYPRHCTGIVDDTHIKEKNRPEDILIVPDFCEPLVPRGLWSQVQALRDVRRQRHPGAGRGKTGSNGKLIAPLAPGMAINYLMSGLLYCGLCRVRMTASSSRQYTTAAGAQRRYVAYVCPGHQGGQCTNSLRVPEQWIRQVAIDALRDRLFPRAG